MRGRELRSRENMPRIDSLQEKRSIHNSIFDNDNKYISVFPGLKIRI